jgi:ATP-dependent 26S proteasome regulatory subunit
MSTNGSPYADSRAHLRAELGRVDTLLAAHLRRWLDANDGVVDEYRGLYVADETVAAVVAEADDRAPTDARDADVSARAALSLAAGVDLRLARLAATFDLSPTEVDVLLFALAPDLDPAYELQFSYLQDDVTRKRPTVHLLARLLAGDERGDGPARPRDGRDASDPVTRLAPFARDAPLRREGLVTLAYADPGTPFASRPVAVTPRVRAFLLGSDAVDAALSGVVTRHTVADPPTLVGEAARLFERASQADAPVVVVSGPPGTGRRALAAAVSHARDDPLLVVDAARLGDDAATTADAIRREALLQGGTVFVTTADRLPAAVLDSLADVPGPLVLASETPWYPETVPPSRAVVTGSLSVPDVETRRDLWADAVDTLVSADTVDDLATTFHLTPGQVTAAVARATQETEGAVTRAALFAACRGLSSLELGTLGRRVEPTYGWDDIVLSPDRHAQLREVADQIRRRSTVYSTWGFEGRFSLGNGTVALFSGPPGTGKTMAAEVVARDVGLDLYRVDLASVVSKYIGETEKNLARVFDAAEASNAILLFDEADALFGKRSDVSDAHDRYANVEVAYLLQRVEAYDGAVVLTTNHAKHVDEAFLRRIHHRVDFSRPDAAVRERIWRGIYPDETPVGDLDYAFLASFAVTGGNIKNVALRAAFLATADERVEMTHVVRAMRRELQKEGTLIDPAEFEPYRELL